MNKKELLQKNYDMEMNNCIYLSLKLSHEQSPKMVMKENGERRKKEYL